MTDPIECVGRVMVLGIAAVIVALSWCIGGHRL